MSKEQFATGDALPAIVEADIQRLCASNFLNEEALRNFALFVVRSVPSETPQFDEAVLKVAKHIVGSERQRLPLNDGRMATANELMLAGAILRTTPSAIAEKREEYHPNLDGPAEPVGRSLCIFREGCRLDACAGEQRCCGRDVP